MDFIIVRDTLFGLFAVGILLRMSHAAHKRGYLDREHWDRMV